eukprot:g7108.t1
MQKSELEELMKRCSQSWTAGPSAPPPMARRLSQPLMTPSAPHPCAGLGAPPGYTDVCDCGCGVAVCGRGCARCARAGAHVQCGCGAWEPVEPRAYNCTDGADQLGAADSYDCAREFYCDEHSFSARKRSLWLFRCAATLEEYQGFLLPQLADADGGGLGLVQLLAMEERRLELGINEDEHELCLIGTGWTIARFHRALDEEAWAHMAASGQVDAEGRHVADARLKHWRGAGSRGGWYRNVLKGVLLDGVIDARERLLLRAARLANGISNVEHADAMLGEGITPEEEERLGCEGLAYWPHAAVAGGRRTHGGRDGWGGRRQRVGTTGMGWI